MRANGLPDNPTFKIDIDREKASAFGINLSDVDQTFSIAWGSRYVNNFLDTDGRIKKVYVQADAPFRMNPDDLNGLYVRNINGSMVPFTSFATGSWTYGSPKLERYNGVSSFEIQGQAAAGQSTGQAMAVMQSLAKQLPAGVGYEWTGISLQQQQSSSQAPLLYGLSLLVVLLALAALYESWSIPISVIMVVPLGILGALAAATALHLENDVYFQVGLLTTIGLSSKNAILIVEFARDLEAEGKSIARRRHRSRALAVAADPDDVAGVRPWRAALGHFQRRRVGQPERGRPWRHRRHAGRHVLRPVPDSDVLLRDPRQAVQAEGGASAGIARVRPALEPSGAGAAE